MLRERLDEALKQRFNNTMLGLDYHMTLHKDALARMRLKGLWDVWRRNQSKRSYALNDVIRDARVLIEHIM